MPKKKLRIKSLYSSGITLVEILVVVGVCTVIFGTSAGMFIQSRKGWHLANTKVELAENARWALDFITKEIQGVGMRGELTYDNESAPDIKAGFCDPHETGTLDDDVWGLSFLVDDIDGDGVVDRMWYWQGDGNTHADCDGTSAAACFGEEGVLYRAFDNTTVFWGHNEGTSLEKANRGDNDTWNATSNSFDTYDYRQEIARFLTDNPIDPATTEPYPIFSEECSDRDGDDVNDTLFINLMLTLEHPLRPGKAFTFRRKVYMRNIDLEVADPNEEIYCQ